MAIPQPHHDDPCPVWCRFQPHPWFHDQHDGSCWRRHESEVGSIGGSRVLITRWDDMYFDGAEAGPVRIEIHENVRVDGADGYASIGIMQATELVDLLQRATSIAAVDDTVPRGDLFEGR